MIVSFGSFESLEFIRNNPTTTIKQGRINSQNNDFKSRLRY